MLRFRKKWFKLVCADRTCFARMLNAVQEDSREPLERILVHGIDVCQIAHTKEQDLCVYGNRHIFATSHVNVLFGLLGYEDFGLNIRESKN
jgi:hypothetical protein